MTTNPITYNQNRQMKISSSRIFYFSLILLMALMYKPLQAAASEGSGYTTHHDANAVPPTVSAENVTITPSGNMARVTGTLEITFPDPLGKIGNVTINGIAMEARLNHVSNGKNKALVTYRDLDYGTKHTVSISGFVTANGNPIADSTRAFTTRPAISAARTIWVAPNGNDAASGEKAAPFKTLQRAQREVRKYNRSMRGDIFVYLKDGTYEQEETLKLTAEDSGMNGYQVIWKAAPGARPTVSGGKTVTSNWIKVSGKPYWKTSLKRDKKLRYLYVDGVAAEMTHKKLRGEKVPENYTAEKNDTWAYAGTPEKKEYKNSLLFKSTELPVDTKNPQDIEIFQTTRWHRVYVTLERLKRDQAKSDMTRADLQMPYGLIAQDAEYAKYTPWGGQDVCNVFAWLEKPGEFYFDRAEQELYYIPRSGQDMEKAHVVVPQVNTLVNIEGENRDERVHDIQISGIDFAHSDWNLVEVDGSHGRASMQGTFVKTAYSGERGQWTLFRDYDAGAAAMMISSAEDIRIVGNTVRHVGSDGITILNDVVNSLIEGNAIYDVAGTAIPLGHVQHIYIGDAGKQIGTAKFPNKEKFSAVVEGICKNVIISDNFMHDAGKVFRGSPGFYLAQAENCTVQYNYLESTPYSGFSIGWGWVNFNGRAQPSRGAEKTESTHDNVINNNVLRNTIYQLDDGGAIYTLGEMPGTQISENYIDQIGHGPNMKVRGIHLDEGTVGLYGEGNVVDVIKGHPWLDAGRWGDKGPNVWKGNYSTVTEDKSTLKYESETVIEGTTVVPSGLWNADVFKILQRCGPRGKYMYNIPQQLLALQDHLLPASFALPAGTSLEFRGNPEQLAQAEVWLAPPHTTSFEEGASMTKAKGTRINVPAEGDAFHLYLKKGKHISAASKHRISPHPNSDEAVVENVEETGRYRTSAAKPFVVHLKPGSQVSVTLSGKPISKDVKIAKEGQHELNPVRKAILEVGGLLQKGENTNQTPLCVGLMQHLRRFLPISSKIYLQTTI